MQRILNVEYSLPSRANVSAECRDLLSKLLVADPRARIPLEGVWQHPWFQRDLPEGVSAMNIHLLANPATFNGPGDQVGSSSGRPNCGDVSVGLDDLSASLCRLQDLSGVKVINFAEESLRIPKRRFVDSQQCSMLHLAWYTTFTGEHLRLCPTLHS